MWLFLEYDKRLREEATLHLRQAGIQVFEVWREDQIDSMDFSRVSLVLVGREWKRETLTHLRDIAMDAHTVYVTLDGEERPDEKARHLGCQDYVTYPLPIPYLRAWAKTYEATVGLTDERPVSPIESIVNRRRAQLNRHAISTVPQMPIRRIEPTRAKIVSFQSVAGGVGKTVLTSLCASYLSEHSYQTAVVDLVPQGILLHMHRGASFVTMDEWAKLPMEMDERMVHQSLVHTSSGFSLLPSGIHRQPITSETVHKVLLNLAKVFDVVLVDTIHDDSPGTRAALEFAHHITHVMTPEWTSFKRNVEEIIQLTSTKGERAVSLVVNRVRPKSGEHGRTLRVLEEADLGQLQKTFVPEDKTLYRQLMNAIHLKGSRIVQSKVRALVDMFMSDHPSSQTGTDEGGWMI